MNQLPTLDELTRTVHDRLRENAPKLHGELNADGTLHQFAKDLASETLEAAEVMVRRGMQPYEAWMTARDLYLDQHDPEPEDEPGLINWQAVLHPEENGEEEDEEESSRPRPQSQRNPSPQPDSPALPGGGIMSSPKPTSWERWAAQRNDTEEM